ncbi:hypothetical protein QC764_0086010 [Podospora pseudoanserina]|uniref:Uncharacterized protein n=1 Tax=Podospora pseudoanserina TaxID=2609844 RepID=A0ABR0I7R4_9PEZI|nr:hypothetical protein QC764_0086010 [Podospora pseudoanserina]
MFRNHAQRTETMNIANLINPVDETPAWEPKCELKSEPNATPPAVTPAVDPAAPPPPPPPPPPPTAPTAPTVAPTTAEPEPDPKPAETESTNTKRKTPPSSTQPKATPKRAKTPGDLSREWQRQYFQGAPLSEFKGITSGELLLGTTGYVASQAPIQGQMMIEIIAAAPDQPLGGAVRLKALPEGVRPGEEEMMGELGQAQDVFLFPLRHVEDIIITRGKALQREAWNILIVPSQAVGAQPLRWSLPEIVSFSWTGNLMGREKANLRLGGRAAKTVEEASKDKKVLNALLCVDVLEEALNEALEPYRKRVQKVDLIDEFTKSLRADVQATLSSAPELKGKPCGNIHVYPAGILFKSKSRILYMPFRNIECVTLTVAFCLNQKQLAGLSMGVQVKKGQRELEADEAEAKRWERETVGIYFKKIELRCVRTLKRWLEEAGVRKLELEKESYYDYAKGSITGECVPYVLPPPTAKPSPPGGAREVAKEQS